MLHGWLHKCCIHLKIIWYLMTMAMKDESSAIKDNSGLHLDQKRKLNEFCMYIVTKASIDYNTRDIIDLYSAVYAMLSRVASRINDRGIFSISRIQSCGSMAERTSVWKTDKRTGETYTEYDFLAVLKDTVINNCDQNCKGCVQIEEAPMKKLFLKTIHNKPDTYYMDSNSLRTPSVLNNLFWQEITYCLTSSCTCLFLNYFDNNDINYQNDVYDALFTKVQFEATSEKYVHGCDKCVIKMGTGTLRVNTNIAIDQRDKTAAKCSLIFLWTSETKTLFAPDKHLQAKQQMQSFPVFVDFLPALQYSNSRQSENENEQDRFIIPRQCSACGRPGRWMMSSCMAEINTIVNGMSDKHRRCFKVIKYLLPIIGDINSDNNFSKINTYHMKNIVLRHSASCLDSTDDVAGCILDMFYELKRSYERKSLHSPFTCVNFLDRDSIFTESMAQTYRQYIDKICSVSENDCWKMYIEKLVSFGIN